MMNEACVPIIIPAYEPDERLVELIRTLKKEMVQPVIIVDDGSGDRYNEIFSSVKNIMGDVCTILVHEYNRGKGRALKTAFSYVLDKYPDAIGVVTADSDGQHSVKCIMEVKNKLQHNTNSLILGIRNFDKDGIPWKSEFGNKLTKKVLKYVSGVNVSDTQTGLRGIPRSFIEELINVSGERFEFETQMLMETYGKYDIIEVEIATIYDSKEDHQTHFNMIKDSYRIYKLFGIKFLKYIASSLSSSIVDIVLFTVLCYLLKEKLYKYYIIYATVIARVVSSTYNFLINYKVVFKSKTKIMNSMIKYFALAIIQMSLSAVLVLAGTTIFPCVYETIIKIVVDTILFFVSYKIQQRFVF